MMTTHQFNFTTLLAIFIAFSFDLFCQPENPAVHNYTTSNGLSANTITAIVQENGGGRIWIGTTNGLNSFDGRSFFTLNHIHADSNSIASNYISALGVDTNSNLWVGYANGGLQAIDLLTSSVKSFPELKSLPTARVNSIYVDTGNVVWIGLNYYGMAKFDLSTKQLDIIPLPNLKDHNNDPYNSVNKICEDSLGVLWLATSNSLYSYHKKNETFTFYSYNNKVEGLRDDLFRDILYGDDDQIWLASWAGGLSLFDLRTKNFHTYKYATAGKSIVRNIVMGFAVRNNRFWLATMDSGLLTFDTSIRKFISQNKLTDSDDVHVTHFNCIFLDQSGSIWAGTELHGLFKISLASPTFKFIPLKIPAAHNPGNYSLTRIIYDTLHKKNIIATLSGNGLNVIDHENTIRNYKSRTHLGSQSDQRIWDILHYKNNLYWVVGRDFVDLFNIDTEEWLYVDQPDNPARDNKYYRIVKDRANRTWLTTSNNGIFYTEPNQSTFQKFTAKQLPSAKISDVAFDRAGNMFIATFDRGLVIIKKDSSLIHLSASNHQDDIKGNLISRLLVDREDNLWISTTDNGIMRISVKKNDRQQFQVENFTQNAWLNLPSSDIIEDDLGKLWIATIKGLLKYDPESNVMNMYNKSHGLNESYHEYLLSLSNKKIFIGLYGGYYEFDPRAIRKDKPTAPISLNAFRVNGNEYLLSKNGDALVADLSYDENMISVDFTRANFEHESDAKLFYKLEGIDQSWVEDAGPRNVTYSNLPPGKFTFDIVSDNVVQPDRHLKILISISPPFWKTRWFYLMVGAIIIVTAYVLIENRIKTIRQEEALKTEFNKKLAESQLTALQAQMNPHFIFNSLNSINRYIIKERKHEAADYLSKFSKLIRLILENSEEKMVHLSKELKTLQLYLELESLRYENKFLFDIVVDDKLDDDIMIPGMILQPFLENSIWHGILHKENGVGRIRVELQKLDDHFLRCTIIDNGIGRKKADELQSRTATKRKSYGIQLSNERLRIINQDQQSKDLIQITDLYDIYGEPEGTRVEIKLRYFRENIMRVLSNDTE